MADVTCPDCDKRVTDDTEKCPQCGFPVREFFAAQHENGAAGNGTKPSAADTALARTRRNLMYGLLAALVIISISIVVMVWLVNSQMPQKP